MPLRPALSDDRNCSWSSPIALRMPSPVTTTRLISALWRSGALRLQQLRNAGDHLTYVCDLFRLFIVNLDIELALEIKQDIEKVEGINTQVLKRTFGPHILQWNATGGSNDSDDSILDSFGHRSFG